jgi:predicted nucleotidyltransferase
MTTYSASLLPQLVDEVKRVEGVQAIVLGGSRARGTHTLSSDIDLGIYYRPSYTLNLNQLREVAANLDDEHRADVITEPGGWGPWINGEAGSGFTPIPLISFTEIWKKSQRLSTIVCRAR